MFIKNKTHLTRLFIYLAYFSPENRFKSLGEKEKKTGIRMDEKDQNPAILNSGPIQKHLVDLQTRVSSTLQSIQTAAFQLLLLLLHPYKHREGNRAKIIESLSPSYNLFFFFFFRFDVQSSRWIRQNPGLGGDSWCGPIVVGDRYSAFKSTGWRVRVWSIASKLEIVPMNISWTRHVAWK